MAAPADGPGFNLSGLTQSEPNAQRTRCQN